jgi:small subunit ribosomal protein S1
VVADLDGDVEGFVPVSQLGVEDMRTPEEHFSAGETLNMVVVEFDREQKRIVLSVKRYLERQSEEELQEYLAAHVQRPITIADMVETDGEGPTEGTETVENTTAVEAKSEVVEADPAETTEERAE